MSLTETAEAPELWLVHRLFRSYTVVNGGGRLQSFGRRPALVFVVVLVVYTLAMALVWSIAPALSPNPRPMAMPSVRVAFGLMVGGLAAMFCNTWSGNYRQRMASVTPVKFTEASEHFAPHNIIDVRGVESVLFIAIIYISIEIVTAVINGNA